MKRKYFHDYMDYKGIEALNLWRLDADDEATAAALFDDDIAHETLSETLAEVRDRNDDETTLVMETQVCTIIDLMNEEICKAGGIYTSMAQELLSSFFDRINTFNIATLLIAALDEEADEERRKEREEYGCN